MPSGAIYQVLFTSLFNYRFYLESLWSGLFQAKMRITLALMDTSQKWTICFSAWALTHALPSPNTGSIRSTYDRCFAAGMIVVLIVFSSRWSLLSYIPVDCLGSILRRL
jgi:hypothetical protein